MKTKLGTLLILAAFGAMFGCSNPTAPGTKRPPVGAAYLAACSNGGGKESRFTVQWDFLNPGVGGTYVTGQFFYPNADSTYTLFREVRVNSAAITGEITTTATVAPSLLGRNVLVLVSLVDAPTNTVVGLLHAYAVAGFCNV